MSFEQALETHDPNGRLDWTFRVRLNPGEQIASAVVDVVDPTSTNVDLTTDIVIESVSFGLISGTVWGVTMWYSGGTPGVDYFFRCRGVTNSTPISRKFDKTVSISCAQR
jgi:hypothetical protein